MLPQEFVQRMKNLLGEEAEAFFASYDRPRNAGIRINTLKAPNVPLSFCGDPIPWAENGYYLQDGTRPGLHPFHDAGVYYLQEPSAMAPVGLLDVQPGQRVLDLCAAPGGKTTQIAEKLRGKDGACDVMEMTSVSKAVLEKKAFHDYSGNNINHPNDFFSRIYAQTLLEVVVGYENIK